jgi:8-oxo-dGTP diphosphatase
MSDPRQTPAAADAAAHTQTTSVHWPQVAASAAIFRGRSVLLGERGQGPRKGSWSLPGGRIEPGETAAAAARREILEETGLAVELAGLLDVHDVIQPAAGGGVSVHYVLAVYYGTSSHGEPIAATDISDARFVPLEDIESYPMTDGAVRLIREAARKLGID